MCVGFVVWTSKTAAGLFLALLGFLADGICCVPDLLLKWWRSPRNAIPPQPPLFKDVLLETRLCDEKGHYYPYMLDGKQYKVRIVESRELKTSRVEMAIPGSYFYPAGTQFTEKSGLVSFRDSQSNVIGMGCKTSFRKKPVIMTAEHVWNLLLDTSGCLIETHGKVIEYIEAEWAIVCSVSSLDVVFLEPVNESTWSRLPTKGSVTLGVPTAGSVITTWGYDKNSQFTRSAGPLHSVQNQPFAYEHESSTLPGYSGTPIFHNKLVVGVHLGHTGNGKNPRNTAVGNFWALFSLMRKEESANYFMRDYNIEWDRPTRDMLKSGKMKRIKVTAFGHDADVYIGEGRVYIDSPYTGQGRADPLADEQDFEDHIMNLDPREYIYESGNTDFLLRDSKSPNRVAKASATLPPRQSTPGLKRGKDKHTQCAPISIMSAPVQESAIPKPRKRNLAVSKKQPRKDLP